MSAMQSVARGRPPSANAADKPATAILPVQVYSALLHVVFKVGLR